EEPGAADTAEPLEMLLLDEAEIAPVEEERGPSGFEQAAADVESTDSFAESAEAPEEVATADTSDAWAWDEEGAARYDLAPASAARGRRRTPERGRRRGGCGPPGRKASSVNRPRRRMSGLRQPASWRRPKPKSRSLPMPR